MISITVHHTVLYNTPFSVLNRFSHVHLCDPMDCSLLGSSLHGILQARTLEWVAISFSSACMHAKSPQSCPTLCDPMDSSPPGFFVHRILQARILEWAAISFSIWGMRNQYSSHGGGKRALRKKRTSHNMCVCVCVCVNETAGNGTTWLLLMFFSQPTGWATLSRPTSPVFAQPWD